MCNSEKEESKIKEISLESGGRYSRLELIPWWDQKMLLNARIMVVGAGAVGNEVLKNLSLVGVGNIYIVDFDKIEHSNLSRAILFRSEDKNRKKVEVAAERIHQLNPDVKAYPIDADVIYDIGLGFFRRMDVVIGCLDNREARLAINRACWKVNVPWIDGAINTFDGIARIFYPPDNPCYECTMTEKDYEIIRERRSCQLLQLTLEPIAVPTTPTIASVIGAIQVQEALKILHKYDMKNMLVGKGFFFNGINFNSYTINYTRRTDCPSHITFDHIIELENKVSNTTLGDILSIGRKLLGKKAIIDFNNEIVHKVICPTCGTEDTPLKVLNKVEPQVYRCLKCDAIKDVRYLHSISGNEPFLDKTLAEIGIPPLDIINARVGMEKWIQLEFTGDLNLYFLENK